MGDQQPPAEGGEEQGEEPLPGAGERARRVQWRTASDRQRRHPATATRCRAGTRSTRLRGSRPALADTIAYSDRYRHVAITMAPACAARPWISRAYASRKTGRARTAHRRREGTTARMYE